MLEANRPDDALNQNEPVFDNDEIEKSVPPSLLTGVMSSISLTNNKPSSLAIPDVFASPESHQPVDNWWMRVAVIQQSGQSENTASIDTLKQALQDDHVAVRAAAVSALARQGSTIAIKLLLTSLHDEEWQVRERVLLALAHQDTMSLRELYPLLLEAGQDPDAVVREAASYASKHLYERQISNIQEDNQPFQLSSIESQRPQSQRKRERSAGLWPQIARDGIWHNWYKPALSKKLRQPLEEKLSNSDEYIAGQIVEWLATSELEKKGRQKPLTVPTTLVVIAVVAVLFSSWFTLHNTLTFTAQQPQNHTSVASATINYQSGSEVYNYNNAHTGINALVWSRDSKTIAIADNTVRLFDTLTGKNSLTYQNSIYSGNETGFISLDWSHDGTKLLGVKSDQLVIWNSKTGQQLATYNTQIDILPYTTYNLTRAIWSPDDNTILITASDKQSHSDILLWDFQARRVIHNIEKKVLSVSEPAWSPDGQYLAFRSGNEIQVWNSQITTQIASHPGGSFDWGNDSQSIILYDQANHLITWNITNDQNMRSTSLSLPMGNPPPDVKEVAVSPIDDHYTAFVAQYLEEWNLATNTRLLINTQCPTGDDTYTTVVMWSPDGKFIARSCNTPGPTGVLQIMRAYPY